MPASLQGRNPCDDKVAQIFGGKAAVSTAKSPTLPAIEIWTVPKAGLLPTHVEALNSDQIRLVLLGRIPTNRGVRDYRSAASKMTKDLAANPKSVGVVFGYFLEQPSTNLLRRLREIRRIFKRSGLPPDRYLVRTKRWDDEVSTYPPDSEPQYPTTFVVELASTSKER
jgi:hypothetical protein